MNENYRVIPLEQEDDSYMKMAKEEAIMNSLRQGTSPPTLRFYSWTKPAVALGYFQKADEELNLNLCKKDNIEVFRRLTGGGAVYKSPQYEFNYSFIIREDDPTIPKDVEKSYEIICSAIIIGLKKLGFETKFKPINDIMLDGKKVSGNAQTRVDNVILHHGTILLKPQVEEMFKYLKIDEEKLLKKKVKDVKDLVTGLNEIKKVTKQQLQEAIIKGFSETFSKSFIQKNITQEEQDFANQAYKKYSNDEFIYWR
jgi:lipoate-protein ligase A